MRAKLRRQVNHVDRDYKGELKMSGLMSLFQEAADVQSRQMGTDNVSLKSIGKAWILSRVMIEVLKPVSDLKEVIVTTYPRVGKGIEFFREYAVTLPKGGMVARASSSWSIIDLDTRRLIRGTDMPHYSDYCEDIPMLEREYKKVRAVQEQLDNRYTYRAGIGDLDLLGHVNNTRYADIALNALTREEYERGIKSFNLTFIREIRAGDSIEVGALNYGDKTHIQGGNEDVKFACEVEYRN